MGERWLPTSQFWINIGYWIKNVNRDILLELSYFDLEGRTTTQFGNDRKEKSNRVQMQNLKYVPFIDNRALKVISNTSSGKGDYNTSILFSNINYVNTGDLNDEPVPNSQDYTFTAADNSEYTIERVPKGVQVKVNCSCLDFHYRFAVWDNQYRALDGTPPPPYVRTGNRSPVNPNKSPGLCKHLMKMVEQLQADGFFA